MYVPFENLPSESKIWIYQSNRKFSDDEIAEIETALQAFFENWAAHGTSLESSYQLKYNRFIIIAVNQEVQAATGCSIDSSVRFVKELEAKMSLDLMNKLNISFKDGENINIVSLAEFQDYAKENKITSETIVFNNMVQTKEELLTKWEVPAKESWHQRFLN